MLDNWLLADVIQYRQRRRLPIPEMREMLPSLLPSIPAILNDDDIISGCWLPSSVERQASVEELFWVEMMSEQLSGVLLAQTQNGFLCKAMLHMPARFHAQRFA